MTNLLALLLLAIVPAPIVRRDAVERFELNHFFDDNGHLVFSQIIGWESTEVVRFWRMAKTADMTPRPDATHGGYVLRFLDGDVTREVRARSFGESWTQYDIETENRTILPPEARRRLKER